MSNHRCISAASYWKLKIPEIRSKIKYIIQFFSGTTYLHPRESDSQRRNLPENVHVVHPFFLSISSFRLSLADVQFRIGSILHLALALALIMWLKCPFRKRLHDIPIKSSRTPILRNIWGQVRAWGAYSSGVYKRKSVYCESEVINHHALWKVGYRINYKN